MEAWEAEMTAKAVLSLPPLFLSLYLFPCVHMCVHVSLCVFLCGGIAFHVTLVKVRGQLWGGSSILSPWVL